MNRGYLLSADDTTTQRGTLRAWETRILDSIGMTIEFWGFKANHGRVWGLLYLRDQRLSAGEIEKTLALSKGAVNTILRELEQWSVVRRVRAPGTDAWIFEAESDFGKMIGRVFLDRELKFILRIESDLAAAEVEARASKDASPSEQERIKRMRLLSERLRLALQAFVNTARMDLKGWGEMLREGQRRLTRKR